MYLLKELNNGYATLSIFRHSSNVLSMVIENRQIFVTIKCDSGSHLNFVSRVLASCVAHALLFYLKHSNRENSFEIVQIE